MVIIAVTGKVRVAGQMEVCGALFELVKTLAGLIARGVSADEGRVGSDDVTGGFSAGGTDDSGADSDARFASKLLGT